MYQLETKSDFQSGTTLVLSLPEEEVDQKALYTMAANRPEFLLPFRYKMVDGQVELSYQIGKKNKLAYVSGPCTTEEYVDLWVEILQPLLDCDDWFMNSYSFVLDAEHLYCDKNRKSVGLIYIPSVIPASDYELLKGMVAKVARMNPVEDVHLENKVMWALQEFNPKDFLQILKPYRSQKIEQNRMPIAPPIPPSPPMEESSLKQSVKSMIPPIPQVFKETSEPPVMPPKQESSVRRPSDIEIHFPQEDPKEKKQKEKKEKKGGLFGFKKESAPKEKKVKSEEKESRGFWGKKKEKNQQILEGAAAVSEPPEMEILQQSGFAPAQKSAFEEERFDVTELDIDESEGAKFRYVGYENHPRVIDVNIRENGIFTIGRFDPSVGVKQCSFEFDKRTKAVSRRHAAVERKGEKYFLVDLSSSAGTYINGQKLPPNTPVKLERGCRVAFGHSGADYVWEE